MDIIEVMRKRRSIRSYTGESVPDEIVEKVLQAGMLSPSGHGRRSWEFIVVKDRETLDKLSLCRQNTVKMLQGGDVAIVVIGDAELSDMWVEDCSIAMANMHLAADSLGVGSCWVQVRCRKTASGEDSGEYIRSILGFPEKYMAEAILALGMPAEHPAPRELSDLPAEKIHYEKF